MAIGDIILHVGTGKTGSTSIQETMAGYDDGRIRFATLGPRNHSPVFAGLFGSNPVEQVYFRRRGISGPALEEVCGSWRNRLENELQLDRDKLIFSGESINLMQREELERTRDFLAPRCGRIQVIAYIRSPASFLSSLLQQKIKTGERPDVLEAPRFRARFEKFVEIFEDPKPTFFKFEPSAFPRGSVVAHFCNFVGIRSAPEEVRANESLSAPATKLLNHLNKYGETGTGHIRFVKARKRLVGRLSKTIPGARFDVAHLLPRSLIDNAETIWMEECLGTSLLDIDVARAPNDFRALEAYLADISPDTVRTLRRMAPRVDVEGLSESDTLTALLNALFRKALAREEP